MVNRTQALVLSFFLMVLTSLVVILAAAPEVYDQALRWPPSWPRGWRSASWSRRLASLGCSPSASCGAGGGPSGLILVAFLAGVLRVPGAGLELAGLLMLMATPGMSSSRGCSASSSSRSG
jgi:hypothetical protein